MPKYTKQMFPNIVFCFFLSVLYCTSCSASNLWQCTDSVPSCNWVRVERLITDILQKRNDYACFLYVIFTLLKVTKVCSVSPLRLNTSDFLNIFILVETKGCVLVSQNLPQSLILKLTVAKNDDLF